jgi:hypothetical protein
MSPEQWHEWEVRVAAKFATQIHRVDEILAARVRDNPEDPFISYERLHQMVPEVPGITEAWSPDLFDILGVVSLDSKRAGRGMLSVIVVNKDKHPGKGFFSLAREHPELRHNGSNEEIYVSEFTEVQSSYRA